MGLLNNFAKMKMGLSGDHGPATLPAESKGCAIAGSSSHSGSTAASRMDDDTNHGVSPEEDDGAVDRRPSSATSPAGPQDLEAEVAGSGKTPKRWVPKAKGNRGGGRRASSREETQKSSSTSSLFNSFRRKSQPGEDQSSIAKRCSFHLSITSRARRFSDRDRSDSATATSRSEHASEDVSALLREMDDDARFKMEARLNSGPSYREPLPSTDGPPSKEDCIAVVVQDVPSNPAAGFKRPTRRPSIMSSTASMGSVETYLLDDNDLDVCTLDSESMLAELGPAPTSRELSSVAAVRAKEYINEHLFEGKESVALDREKWENIPQYSKSELMVRRHLGKGTFSDAFEVTVMVAIEEDGNKLGTSDESDLDSLLEAKFKGPFKGLEGSFGGSSKNGEGDEVSAEKASGETEGDSKDDLDREIEAMFGAKEVKTAEEPKASQPAKVPSTPARRLRGRRQTLQPDFSASICVGSLPTTALSVQTKRVTYAMKCLRPQIRSDAEQFIVGVEDLVHETAMLASLDHPNIIKLHGRAGCGSGGGSGLRLSDGYFILLDRLTDTLEDRVVRWKAAQDGGCKAPTVGQVRTAHCIADALSYLHSRNIIFRDLKPANVGFDSSGTLKLFDFGFAMGLNSTDEPGADDLVYDVCGTPRYMAPEVALGTGYGLPADVHSFGILLWEICCLRKPFAKIKTRDEFHDIVHEKGGRPKLSKYWPEKLRETMAGCWTSFPGERPGMDEVKNMLRTYAEEMSGMQQQKDGDSSKTNSVFRRLTG